MNDNEIRVNRSLRIPQSEIELRFSTSGGPGGQHANKAATRADVAWNVEASTALGPRQRERIRRLLAHRIDRSGTLRVSSNRFRSQTRNREDALQRLADLIADALRPRKPRRATRPPQAATERRLADKKRRSETKRLRRATTKED